MEYVMKPIGLSTLRVLSRNETILNIRGVVVLDGIPLLDTKPCIIILAYVQQLLVQSAPGKSPSQER